MQHRRLAWVKPKVQGTAIARKLARLRLLLPLMRRRRSDPDEQVMLRTKLLLPLLQISDTSARGRDESR